MIWSKTKNQFESLTADCFGDGISVYVTEYTRNNPADVGRGWITLNGEQFVTVQIPSFYSDNYCFRTETMDFGEAVRAYLNLSMDQIANSGDEIIQGLRFLDRRLGKRALRKVIQSELHPFALDIFRVRVEAEKEKGSHNEVSA